MSRFNWMLLGCVLVGIAFWISVGYIILHFVQKYW